VTKQLPHNGSSFNHLVGTSSIGFSVDIRGENTNYFARDYCQQHGKAQVRNVKTVGNIKAELTGWDFWKGHV